MKKFSFLLMAMFSFALIFSSCQKNELDALSKPEDSSNPNTNVPSDSVFAVSINVKMEVGSIVYDSASTNITVISWDKNNVAHEKEISISANNNKVYLVKTHQKFQFKFQKWGITEQLTFTKEQIKEGDVISFGGKSNQKQLSAEESFMEAGGVTRPYSKVNYLYNENGLVKQIDYFQAENSTNDLKFSFKMVYSYEAGLLNKVAYFDAENKSFGTSVLTYTANGKIATIKETKYGQTVNATFKYVITNDVENILAEYSFDNGNKMNYTIKYKNGNIIEDIATGTSGEESGKYEYDSNINPYAQMNLYSLFLTNLSKNNNIKQDKVFSGSIPSNIAYKFEYKYDTNGYPTEFEKSFKTYTSNTHLFKIKTLYKY
ncbi:hypothetical protein ABID42_003299 [Arcicella rosea]|uniref:hypothetical protein n=1 Tax=Arcicella rosea TaxID=502909 RepID=UPI00345D62FD